VRFLVPGDPRYTRCDCAASPCPHAVLAVWAFRQLPPAQKAAILSTGRRPAPAPTELLDRVEAALADFCEHGVSGAGSGYPGRLGRVEQACLAEDLVWPAEMLGELAREQERYEDHDSLFAPDNVRELVGELLVRADALRHDTTALPPLLIRGTSADRATVLGKSAFVGLGCGVRLRRGRTELAAYFQDSRSGSMAAIVREFADTEDDPARPLPPFAEMAGAVALRGIASATFAALGGSKLLINGGTRSARGHLSVRQGRGTADASVGDQDFAWEQLRAPVLAEDFAELADRLGALPPSSLRPRRVAEDFHVCAVAAVEGAGFDSATQTVGAVLCDGAGGKAGLAFPFTSRGRPGAEALLARLGSGGASLRFVAGPVRRVPGGLVFEPVALVFEEKGKRVLLQPWVESSAGGRGAGAAGARTAAPADPVAECRGQVQAALEDLLVLGLRRADGEAGRWHDLGLRAESTGLARLAVPLRRLADELEKKAHTLRWDPRPAVRLVLQLTAVLRLAQDLPDG
jgi:hypothetical protein